MARNCSTYAPVTQEPSTHPAVSEAEQTGESKTMPLFGAVRGAVWRPLTKVMF